MMYMVYVCTHTHAHTHNTQEWQPARHIGERPGESRRESQRSVISRASPAGNAAQHTATKLDIGDLEVYTCNKLKTYMHISVFFFLTWEIWRYMSWSSGQLANKPTPHISIFTFSRKTFIRKNNRTKMITRRFRRR